MIKIEIILEGYLKNKYLIKTIDLTYSSPVKISKILKDAKFSSADVYCPHLFKSKRESR